MKKWTPPKKSKRNRHTGRINVPKGSVLRAGKAVRSVDGRLYRVMANDRGHAYGMIVRDFAAL
jgi:hypothetical protein